jgi:hypothetical protein
MAETNQNQGQQTQQAAGTAQAQTPAAQQNQSNQQGAAPAIDYGKIQQMLDGTLAAKEDTALKAYFKQQGLSQAEVEQAIAAFKQQKAANTPDVGAMQAQMAQAQAAAQQAQINSAAVMAAVSLGIEASTIPYVIKMADFSQVAGQDGKINEETLKAALNKVLEDVPALKPQASAASGFVQVGAASGSQGTGQAQQATQTQQTTVATKRWNRWNN